MISNTTSVITPGDFNKNTADPLRNRWTVGQMRHLIKILAGHRVILTTDNQTGYTQHNVSLDNVRQTPGYGTFQVLISYEYAEGKFNHTWTSLDSLGQAIIFMPGASREQGKWAVLDSYREECSRAISLAKAAWAAQGKDHYGKYSATPFTHEVHVRFTSQRPEHRNMGVLTPGATMKVPLSEVNAPA